MVDSDPKQNTLTYNSIYNFDDADLILESSDGILFKIHALILKLTSGFFRNMLSISRDPSSRNESIKMSERAIILEAVLDSIYPNSANVVVQTLSYTNFREVLSVLVNKYDFGAGVPIAKSTFQDRYPSFSPILRFGIAWDFGWIAEAKAASTATLNKNLLCEDARADLAMISSASILQLITFHETRKRAVRNALTLPAWSSQDWGKAFVGDVGSSKTQDCELHRGGLLASQPWYAFRKAVEDELDRRPSGNGLCSLGFVPEAVASPLFSTYVHCTLCSCSPPENHYPARSRVGAALRQLVSSLPEEISC